ncbi:hypothetical protein D3C76_1138970 [compost metagenome]
MLMALANQGLALLAVVDITGERQCIAAQRADFLGHRLDIIQRTRGAYHIGAGFGVGQGNGAADAAATAGDDGDAAVDTESLQDAHGGFSSQVSGSQGSGWG